MAGKPWSSVVRALARAWTRAQPEPTPAETGSDDDDFDDPLLRAVAAAPEIPLRPPAQWLPLGHDLEAVPPTRRKPRP